MIKHRLFVFSLLLISATASGIAVADYVTAIYKEGGGNKMVVATGGEIEVQSGATLDIQSGATLNMQGLTFSAAEIGFLDGVTAGTVAASKAVVVDASRDVATLGHVTIDGNLVTGSTTLSEADLGLVDGLTAGTVTVSKAVTVDANGDSIGARNLTITGALSSATVGTSGDITVTSDTTGGNAGERSNIIGLPKITLAALGTMTNGSTETTAYIDATPTGEWAEVDAGTNVTITADVTYYRDSTNSVKIAFGATAVENDGVDGTIAQDDLSSNESVGFWIYSDQALTSGDLDLILDDTDGTDQSYSIGAVSANTWTWIELDISGCDANCDTVDGAHVLLTAQGAAAFGVSTGQVVNVYLDAMYKWDAADEETLGQNIVQDGVMSVVGVTTAQDQANTPAVLVEYTDYFIHYQSGNDAIVTISNQSAVSGVALVAYQ